jgi:hypothetical protein
MRFALELCAAQLTVILSAGNLMRSSRLTLPVFYTRSLAVVLGFMVLIDPIGTDTKLWARDAQQGVCPRPTAGSVVQEPEDLRSRNGVLKVDLSVRNERLKDGK